MGCVYLIALVLMALATSVSPKPIMVSFGTNKGPIVLPPSTTTEYPRPEDRRAPAPVSETADDIPNPSVYKPFVPFQYRNKLMSFRPNPNLVLGTVQDQKYLGSSDKFALLKRQQARAVGLDYRGPQFFEVQQYELDKERQIPTAKQLFRPIMQAYQRRPDQQWDQREQVPEIGVVYSSGIRYYVPQFAGYDRESQQNSVYDQTDAKYLY